MNDILPILIIGSSELPDDREQIRNLSENTDGCTDFKIFGPVHLETDILDKIKEIIELRPPILFIDALTGGSARAITLAALKAGIPAAVWCHNGRHSLASASIAAGALEKSGHPFVLLHGNPEATATELSNAIKAGKAMRKLRDARIGQLGPLHFNIINSAVDPLVITSRFGSWVVPLTLSALKTITDSVSESVVNETVKTLKERFEVSADDGLIKKAAVLRVALREAAIKHRLDAMAADCWSEVFPVFGINPCLEFAFNDHITACEGDLILALMLLAGREITGGSGFCGDFYSLDESSGKAELVHCAGCSLLHGGEGRAMITQTNPPAASVDKSRMAVVRPHIIPGPGTVLLLHGNMLDELHIRECEITGAELSDQMHVHVRITGDASSFRREAAGNHYTVFRGSHFEAWKLWAKWNNIRVH